MKRGVFMLLSMMMLLVGEVAAETKTLNFTNFDEIRIGSAMRASIKQGTTYRVVATGEPEDLDRLEVEQNGSRLEFSMERGFWQWFGSGRISLDITLPALQKLSLSGSSNASLEMPMGSRPFSAQLSGSSSVNGGLTCGEIDLTLSGSSRATLSGAGRRMTLGGSGSSRYDLKDFTAGEVSARLSGSSHATVRLNGELDARLSGASGVIYYGDVRVGSIETSGASKVRKAQ